MYNIPSSMNHTNEAKPLGKVSTIKTFLQSYVTLLNDPSSVKVFKNMLERCNTEVEGKLEKKIINHLHKIRRTSREFRMNANIGDFNMGDIILDLGSEVNVLPKKTWLLNIIFCIPMTVNDVNLYVAFRRVSGLNSRRNKGEELSLREEVVFSFVKTLLRRISAGYYMQGAEMPDFHTLLYSWVMEFP
jgi:hypothetical protein